MVEILKKEKEKKKAIRYLSKGKDSLTKAKYQCNLLLLLAFFFFKIKKYTKHNTQEKQGKLQNDAVPSVDQNNQYFILYCLYLNC